MKRKIGEIYNKPIVIGDKNLVTRNEIHESELNASTGGGDAPSQPSGSSLEYLDVSGLPAIMKFVLINFSFLVKSQDKDIQMDGSQITLGKGCIPSASFMMQIRYSDIGTGYFDEYMSAASAIALDFSTRVINTLESFDGTILEYFERSGEENPINSIPRITKEEFYNTEA